MARNKDDKKFTLWRSKEDIEKLEKLRKVLKNTQNLSFYKNFDRDSNIYRRLPDLYMDAVKKIHDQDMAIYELTAKLHQLEDLQQHICRIMEYCKPEKPGAKK